MLRKACLILVILVSLISLSFAQEQVTITTYYPSPFGSYNELTVASRQAIGNVDGSADGKVDTNDMAVDSVGNPIAGSLTVAGNVGIGTTSPARRLDIAGGNGIRIQPSALPNPPGAGDVAIDNTDNNLKWYAAGAWQMAGGGALPAGAIGQTLRHDGANWVANSNLFNNGANVGIGTAAPSTKLEVMGGAVNTPDGLIIDTCSDATNNCPDDVGSPTNGQMWLVLP